jgi:hypothetical protein
MEPIRLSALGRDVQVGDFYNYFNDNILPGKNFCFILLDNNHNILVAVKNVGYNYAQSISPI